MYRNIGVKGAFFASGCEPALQKRILEAVTPIAEKYVKSGESLLQILELRVRGPWNQAGAIIGSRLTVLKPPRSHRPLGTLTRLAFMGCSCCLSRACDL